MSTMHGILAETARQTDAANGQPVIEVGPFVLRPLRRSDAGLITLHAGDARVARMTTSIPHPLPPGAADAFIARSNAALRDRDVWAIDGSAHGMPELMGVISLKTLREGEAGVGYWVAPAHWNSGIASDALRALLAANPRGARVIHARVLQENTAAARLLINAGFDYQGEGEVFCVGRGARTPTFVYLRRM